MTTSTVTRAADGCRSNEYGGSTPRTPERGPRPGSVADGPRAEVTSTSAMDSPTRLPAKRASWRASVPGTKPAGGQSPCHVSVLRSTVQLRPHVPTRDPVMEVARDFLHPV